MVSFAANDLMAIGAMEAIATGDLRIPQDVAVVGFDDIPQAALTRPPLTTVKQPMYRMGQMAVEMLLAQIEGYELPEMRIELETELIIRGSSVARPSV